MIGQSNTSLHFRVLVAGRTSTDLALDHQVMWTGLVGTVQALTSSNAILDHERHKSSMPAMCSCGWIHSLPT